ncbi:hypothetical protein EBB07_30850 [Paenibacillaceae bacterium]|nr:hypothetical protein EBB07_30850 [Paenibacillaceae bacterium]
MLSRLLVSALILVLLQPLLPFSGVARAFSPDASAAPASLMAFGQNDLGQLGLGHTNNQNVPATVDVNAPVLAVAASNYFTLFVTEGGDVLSTGYGTIGTWRHRGAQYAASHCRDFK